MQNLITRSQFIRTEAMNTARHFYGMQPYDPPRPVTILANMVRYQCQCGFQTSSGAEIYDHVHSPGCGVKYHQDQLNF